VQTALPEFTMTAKAIISPGKYFSLQQCIISHSGYPLRQSMPQLYRIPIRHYIFAAGLAIKRFTYSAIATALSATGGIGTGVTSSVGATASDGRGFWQQSRNHSLPYIQSQAQQDKAS